MPVEPELAGGVEPVGGADEPGGDTPVVPGVLGVVVEEPSVGVDVPPSNGALGLTPPPVAAVAPPVARSLTLTGLVVVIEVELDGAALRLVDAAAESPEARVLEDAGAGVIGRGAGTTGTASLESALGVAACGVAVVRGCATIAARG